jgi:hypothetical protein
MGDVLLLATTRESVRQANEPVEAFMSTTLIDLSNSLADAVAIVGHAVVSVNEGGYAGVRAPFGETAL